MDIQARIIARNYAKAFLNSLPRSLDIQEFERLRHAVRLLKQYRIVPLLKISLLSPEIKKKELLAWFATLQISCPFEPLLDLLLEHQRLFLFVEVLEQLCIEYAARNSIIDVEIQSTYTLKADERSDIYRFLEHETGKRVYGTFIVEKKLIAGLRLQGTNFLWEHSLQQRLHACAKKAI